MEFLLLDEAQKKSFGAQIFDILRACDNDFVPPLSARFSTSDTKFSAVTGGDNGTNAYFEDMMSQHLLAAVEDGVLLGVSLVLALLVLLASGLGAVDVVWYPAIRSGTRSFMSWVAYFAYGGLCALPLILEGKEALRWRSLQSVI